MKKKSFIRILLLYLLFYVILSAIFAVIYSINADDDIPLKELIMFSFAKSVNCSLDSPITISNNIIMIIQSIISQLGMAVLTAYLLCSIFNVSGDNVQLLDKITIKQHGTNDISIGVTVLNKNKDCIYNIKCTMRIFKFYKYGTDELGNLLYRTRLSKEIELNAIEIENYYRFSFPMDSFPIGIWSDIVKFQNNNKNDKDKDKDKDKDNRDDKIDYSWKVSVVITGILNNYGGNFLIKRNYAINDISIAKGTEPINSIKYVNGQFVKTKCNWNNAEIIQEYEYPEKLRIIQEIENYISKSHK